ncbi:Rhodanese-like protein [Clavulina sp. PMI_390]|nr:Rhodanese-like protein [Clavulina sp. PMI_390]
MSSILRSIPKAATRISVAKPARTFLAVQRQTFAVQSATPFGRAMMSTKVAPIVTYEQVKPWTEQPSLDRVIVDVREVHEVEQGSIPSAVNVPLSVLPQALDMHPDTFRNTYGFEMPSKSQEVVFYCRSGKRSTTASELATSKGWTGIKNYTGSWLDWVEKEQGKAAA